MQISQLSASIIYNQYIWNNRYITINNSSYYWKRWVDAGIHKISDIYVNDNFLTPDEIASKYGIQAHFLELLQIRQSLPHSWRHIIVNCNEAIKIYNSIVFPDGKEVRQLEKTTSRIVYNVFNDKKKNAAHIYQKMASIVPFH